MKKEYQEILNKEFVQNKKHPKMSLLNRAAQFAPFAALTGFDDIINESNLDLIEKIELCEDKRNKINEILKLLLKENNKLIKIKYFVVYKDKKGIYKTIIDKILKVDKDKKIIYLKNDTKISFNNIYEISILD